MASPKKLQKLLNGQSLAAEACAQFGYNPFVEMIRCAQSVLVLRPEEKLETFGEWWHSWDLVTKEDGTRMFVVKGETRLKVAVAMAPYLAPQLKSTETKTTEDKTITWVIKTFAAPDTSFKVLPPASENGA